MPELNDAALLNFLQGLVVGVCGYTPTSVFPRWQLNPPNQPAVTDDWAAIGTTRRMRDDFAAIVPTATIDSNDNLKILSVRNQILECLVSFYGPNAESYSEKFAMGLTLPSNLESLRVNFFGLVNVEDGIIVPELVKNQWVMRIDVPFRLRRQQNYTYAVPYLNAADVEIETEFGETIERTVDSGYGISPYNQTPLK